MDNLGEYLKREREKKGITIEGASKVTKIRKTYLEAIENGDLGVQSPVFMRGFLKSYAQFLGLDVNEVMERYSRSISPEKESDLLAEENKPSPSSSRYIIPGITVLAILIIVAAISMLTGKEPAQDKPQVFKPETTIMSNRTTHAMITTIIETPFKPVTTTLPLVKPVMKPITAVSAVKPVMKPITSTVSTVRPAKASTTEIRGKKSLVITAREITWLSITVDDGNPLEILLRKGESATWAANKKFTIISGNAGGTEIIYNGKSLGVMGEQGKVATRVLSE